MKRLYFLMVCVLPFLIQIGCSKMQDPMQPYIEGGEIIYSTKIDSLKSYGGKNRVLFTWELPANHSADKVFAFWNNGKDSAELNFTKKVGKAYLAYLNDLEERTYLFDLYTVDSKGNKSVKVIASANAYGERYESGLQNRFVESAVAVGNVVKLKFGKADEGNIFSEVLYTNTNNENKSLRIAKSNEELQISDWKEGTAVKYRTAFKPQENLIDTFYTKETITLRIKQDVTAIYLKNYMQPFSPVQSQISDRFRDLLDWNINPAMQNHNGMGGWSTDGGTVINMESGWGTPNIVNGKIYQAITLPKGDYSFEVTLNVYGLTTSTVKIVAVPGQTVPNFGSNMEVPGAYASANFDQAQLNFSHVNSGSVALGFLANMIGDQYWRVTKVTLYRYN